MLDRRAIFAAAMNFYRVVSIKRRSGSCWGIEHFGAGPSPRVIQEFWTREEAEAAILTLTAIELTNRCRTDRFELFLARV